MDYHNHRAAPTVADRIAQLKSILEAEPHDTFCLYGLAMEYSKAGEFQRAIEYFDRTLAVDPNYCYAYFHKARALEESGDVAAAQQALRTGLKQAQSCGDAKAAGEIAGLLDELT